MLCVHFLNVGYHGCHLIREHWVGNLIKEVPVMKRVFISISRCGEKANTTDLLRRSSSGQGLP